MVTGEGFVGKISLDVYTSHQRVLSSDHKPLDAVFTLEYNSVVPELKTKIQREVARELDRAENEGRPGITIVVDRSHDNVQVDTPATDGVDFGMVAFRNRISRGLTIANTSQVTSSFEFVARPSESGGEEIAPKWLHVSFPDEEDMATSYRYVV